MFGRKRRLRREQEEIERYARQFRERQMFREEMAENGDLMPDDWREDLAADQAEGIVIPEVPEIAETTELPDGTVKKRKRRRIRIGQFFTGGILSQGQFTKRLPVIIYIVFLMLLYITNGFHLQRKHSQVDRMNEEIKQLKTVAVTTSVVRMTATRQHEIERLLKEMNIPLVIEETPPRVIEKPNR